jgi:FkbM family methyltransferase
MANNNQLLFTARRESNDTAIIQEVFTDDAYQLKKLKVRAPILGGILDIGGHIGSFAVFASALWPDSEIITVEPDDENFSLLEMNCVKYKNVHPLFGAVVGEDEKEWKFLPYHEYPPHATNTGGGRMSIDGSRDVPLFHIQELIAGKGVQLVKIDCEGMEGSILKSARKAGLLGSLPYICGEYHGEQNKDRVRNSLKDSHNLFFAETQERWGLFFAEYKK